MASVVQRIEKTKLSLHGLGVICGLTAGVWLGAAEAPTKLVNSGFSPFAISLCMVAGVFTARWTFPTLLKGTSYVFADLLEKKHLIVWALLAGALWAVANTLTVFAIRDVGLAVAFPMWNANSLIGLLWGRVLFRELDGASGKNIGKVVVGADRDCHCRCNAWLQHDAWRIHGAARISWDRRSVGREPDVGNNVCSLSQGLFEWDESAVVCDGIYGRRAWHSIGIDLVTGWRAALFGIPTVSHAGSVVLAFPRRVRLGNRRPVSAVRCQVPWNRTRNSALQYQSALGAGVGSSRIRRTGRSGSAAYVARHRWIGADDSRCACNQHGGRFSQGA